MIGFPQPEDPYIGILRLDKTFCSEALLIELEANNKVQFNIGDRTNSNHWLESIGYFRDLGEHWRRPALFVQFRRGPMTDEELITKNGKRDQIYIMIKVNDEDVGGAIGLDHIETCLQKAHLSVIPDDNKENGQEVNLIQAVLYNFRSTVQALTRYEEKKREPTQFCIQLRFC